VTEQAGSERQAMRVPVLDGFRGVAILGVVVVHMLVLSGALDTPGSALNVAVFGLFGNVIDAFFIISGFVLFLPVVLRNGHFGSLKTFAVGRAARLLPAYWLSLAVALGLIALAPLSPVTGFPGFGSVALHLGALQTPARLVVDLPQGFGLNGPVWMISLMVGFYAVLPLVARPYFRHPLAGLALAALITVGWKEAVTIFGGELGALNGQAPAIARLIAVDQLPGWTFSFALGMTGAWAYVRLVRSGRNRERIARRAPAVLALGAIVYLGFAYLYGRSAATVNPIVAGSFARESSLVSIGSSASRAVLMAAVVVGPLWLRRPFQSRPARRLGGISYGLYLGHVMIGLYAGLLLGLPTDGSVAAVLLWLAIVVPASLLYGEASARLVERPAARLARRVERRPDRAPSGPAVASP